MFELIKPWLQMVHPFFVEHWTMACALICCGISAILELTFIVGLDLIIKRKSSNQQFRIINELPAIQILALLHSVMFVVSCWAAVMQESIDGIYLLGLSTGGLLAVSIIFTCYTAHYGNNRYSLF